MEPATSQPEAVPSPPASERRIAGPLVAFLFGPLGHIAIGQWRRACGWYAAEVGLGASMFVAAFVGAPKVVWLAVLATLLIRVVMIADVWRLERIHPLPRARLVLVVGIGVAIFYEILGMKVRTSFIEAFRIPSGSMYPALDIGDHIFVKKTGRTFLRGDIVAFRFPHDPKVDYIKRIVAVGGDVVSMHSDQLTINGRAVERRPLDEACSGKTMQGKCTLWEESLDGRQWRVALEDDVPYRDFNSYTVPQGQYFVLGDNRDNSSDSRFWGPVAADLIKGTASFIYWSWDEAHVIRWDRINRPVR
jgi:signal peptidase I